MNRYTPLLMLLAVCSSTAVVASSSLNAQERLEPKTLTSMKSVCTSLEEFIVQAENDRLKAMSAYTRKLEEAKVTGGDVDKALNELSDSNKAWDTAIKEVADKWDKLSCVAILYGKP